MKISGGKLAISTPPELHQFKLFGNLCYIPKYVEGGKLLVWCIAFGVTINHLGAYLEAQIMTMTITPEIKDSDVIYVV